MNNQVALDRLYNTTSTKYGTGISRKEAYEQLNKELEVLNIIKKYKLDVYMFTIFTMYETYETVCKKHRQKSYMTREEWGKVMEWLENEK